MKFNIGTIRRKLLSVLVPEFFWPVSNKINGVDIPIRNMPFSFGIKLYLKKGNYENPERYLVNKYIQLNDKVLEMGSSIGVLTAIIAATIGENGKVLAVEASERLADISRNWLKKFDNVKVIHAFAFPVWEGKKHMNMKFREGNGSLGGRVEFTEPNKDSQLKETAFYLADSVLKYDFHPTVLMVDIEGSETTLLENTLRFPEFLRCIIIELHPNMYDEITKENIIHQLESSGFKFSETIENVYVFLRLNKE